MESKFVRRLKKQRDGRGSVVHVGTLHIETAVTLSIDHHPHFLRTRIAVKATTPENNVSSVMLMYQQKVIILLYLGLIHDKKNGALIRISSSAVSPSRNR